MSLLFSKTKLGSLTLQNHLVMSPMTRSRATGNIPNDLMMQYYTQRASAGLIITEGTSTSPNGLGYPRIPGIFSAEQVAGWKKITNAVHAGGAKMFIQFMHTGRIGHPLNLPTGARVLGPSAVAATDEMYTDAEGMKPLPTPHAMTEADIKTAIAEFAQAAKNAVAAGFDGIELHGANGYLLEQFVRPNSNVRTDRYGGGIENRARFVLEVVDAAIAAIGKDKVGIRLSPFGVFNDMPLYPEMEADYTYLAQKLNAAELLHIHLVDHSSMGAPKVPELDEGHVSQCVQRRAHSVRRLRCCARGKRSGHRQMRSDHRGKAFPGQPGPSRTLENRRCVKCARYGNILYARAGGLHRLSDAGRTAATCLMASYPAKGHVQSAACPSISFGSIKSRYARSPNSARELVPGERARDAANIRSTSKLLARCSGQETAFTLLQPA